MTEPVSAEKSTHKAVAAYKRMLAEILERRPSGTRQRLATALAKNRSFVSQITNPAYPTPIPVNHLASIFDLCHFSPSERQEFVRLYAIAHPRKRIAETGSAGVVSVHLPDMGSEVQNRKLHGIVSSFVREIASLIDDNSSKKGKHQ
ncbi:hypothetical protein [Aestuariivirga sp.]|jgi:hypothetical protein|uniref:hypothetical protein n=1 Tax=Aestuariivirga sp. TaxID=2650926 RepID=UPI003783F39D